jgi:hypothetical protein
MKPLLREVIVGFQGPNKKIEQVSVSVPADWISGSRDALVEIHENQQLRTRLAVAPGAALWAQISDPYEDSPAIF